MNTPVIDALIAASKEATPGPATWKVDREIGRGVLALDAPDAAHRILAVPLGCTEGYRPYDKDRALICAAYNPALVPELEALRARVVELEQQLHDATHCDCGRELGRGYCNRCDNDE